MGADITAYYIRTEELLPRLREAAKFPRYSDERDAILAETIFLQPEASSVDFGPASVALSCSSATKSVLRWLPEKLRQEFEIFDTILLNGEWIATSKLEPVRKNNKYESDLEIIDMPSWIVDREDLRRAKEASVFLDYIKANQNLMQSEDQQFFINHLSLWVETVNAAIERDCELLLTQG